MFTVPVSVMKNDLTNSIEGEGDEEEEDDMLPMILDDDFTTHGLERLSSAATCLVAGVEYTHGEQVSIKQIMLMQGYYKIFFGNHISYETQISYFYT